MPPHENLDGLTYNAATYTNVLNHFEHTVDTVRAQDAYTYTYTPQTFAGTINNTVGVTNDLMGNADTWLEYATYLSKRDLDVALNDFAKRIYKIITEYTRIDITEEEYMRLLHEEG